MKYIHVGINVTDLDRSIEFYQKVFGIEPVKTKADYAKFLLEELGLNFTLNVKSQVQGNQVNHFGFQVNNVEQVLAHKERLVNEGFFVRKEMNTTCCYAVQDKFWFKDPDGNEWEFFYTKEDSYTEQVEGNTCCLG